MTETPEEPDTTPAPKPKAPKWLVAVILLAVALVMYLSIFFKVSHYGA